MTLPPGGARSWISGVVSAVWYVSQTEIEQLIARIAMGDRESFSRLYDAVAPKLLGVALRVLGDRANAEDAMQEAFVKIWRNADRYAVTGHSPMTWLITIARNTAIDRLRRQRPVEDIEPMAEVLPAAGACGEAAAMARSDAARIMACLDELAPDRRDAVRGAYLDGRSYADLAAHHDVPLNTMRTWLRRSLLRLRECMSR
jgi:RNA polymerase sigma-70 factor (ECF subfamily)